MREGELALLVVDLVGSTALYEQLGDELARGQIGECLAAFDEATRRNGGRVVKTLGDGALCTFGDATAALRAATDMRAAAVARAFEMRVAVHAGSAIPADDGDVFGDAVNTVSRLCDIAAKNEVLVSGDAHAELPVAQRKSLRALPAVALRGKREPVATFVLATESQELLTVGAPTVAGAGDAAMVCLALSLGDREVRIIGEGRLTLGREAGCDLVVAGGRASREHAKIFRMGSNFYLVDTSSNGTWLEPDGQPATRLHRECALLIGCGAIHCGADPASATTAEAVRYRVGKVTE